MTICSIIIKTENAGSKTFNSLDLGKKTNLRECADTFGGVADVPHLDVGGGDGED